MKSLEAIDAVEKYAEKIYNKVQARVIVPLNSEPKESETLPGIQILALLSREIPEIDPLQEEFFHQRMEPQTYWGKMILLLKKWKLRRFQEMRDLPF